MGFVEIIVAAMSGTTSEEAPPQDTPTQEEIADPHQEPISPAADAAPAQELSSALPATHEALEQLLADKKAAWQEEQRIHAQERLSQLPEDVRARLEADAKDLEVADLKAQLLQRDLREIAVAVLGEARFPVSLAGLLDYTSKEAMEKSLAKVQDTFKDSLAAAINERLRGKTPEGLGGAANGENSIRDKNSFSYGFAKAVRQ